MAEDDDTGGRREHRPAAAGGWSRKIGGAPAWVWALGAGAAAGVVWFFYRRNKSVAGSQAAATDTTGDQARTTIVPPDYGRAGLSQSQFEQLLAAIQGLYGPASTNPPTDKTTLPAPIDHPVVPPRATAPTHRPTFPGQPVGTEMGGETGIYTPY